MKPFLTEHNSVVYPIDETEEIEVSHIELAGDEFANEPNPKQINRALAAYLAVHNKRNEEK